MNETLLQLQLDAMHRQQQLHTACISELLDRLVQTVDLATVLAERVAVLERLVCPQHSPAEWEH